MGQITIRKIDWDEVAAGKENSMNNVTKELFKSSMLKDQAWIECMQYSPCSRFLAVGNHQQRIFIFSVEKKYKPIKGSPKLAMSGAITGLDWSLDSKSIRASSGAGEVLVFEISKDGER